MIARSRLPYCLALAIILIGAGRSSVAQDSHQTSPPKQVASQGHRNDAALKDDIRKMRTILDQMQTNLTFVGSSTTPLNHQFQLEIEMWRTLLDHMERSVEGGAMPKQPTPQQR